VWSSGIRGACFGVANQILVRRMREKLFTTLLNQDIAFFDAEAVGALTSRLGSDCQQVSQIIGTDLNIMFRNALQGIGAFLYLMVLSWQMALTTLAICSIMWYFMQIYGRSVSFSTALSQPHTSAYTLPPVLNTFQFKEITIAIWQLLNVTQQISKKDSQGSAGLSGISQ
jgi:ABC-type multidrug transport system fused ATPase/permease subunit